MSLSFSPAMVQLVKAALREDIGRRDVTTNALIPRTARGIAYLRAGSSGVLAGLPLVKKVYELLDSRVGFKELRKDGDLIRSGACVAVIRGHLRSILSGERVSLNFLSHLSGVATITRAFVRRVKPYRVKIMDTRKTLPWFRMLEKYAVRCGGGVNHRMNLEEAVMVKDNHLAALRYDWRQLAKSLVKISGKPVIVEVDRLGLLEEAMRLNPDVILLDNMSVREVREAVRIKRRSGEKILLEVSGRVQLEQVRRYAATGVNRISIGALTHSAPHLDFSLEIQPVS